MGNLAIPYRESLNCVCLLWDLSTIIIYDLHMYTPPQRLSKIHPGIWAALVWDFIEPNVPPPPCASTAAVPEVRPKRRFNAHPVLRQGRACA